MTDSEPAAVARAPGLSIWAGAALLLGWVAADDVGFGDAGEIGTAGFGLGVAHPTGFGLDLLLLRGVSLLPIGHIAWRQNLGIAIEAAAALGLLAAIGSSSARRLGVHDATARLAGALLCACALASWRTFFTTANAVEVYSLALAAALLCAYGVAQGGRAAGLCCLVLGFAPGLHVTAGLFALLLLAGWLMLPAPRRVVRFVSVRAPVVLAGALIIAYLPLASLRNPAVDWGDPETFGRVFAHLSAARIRNAYHAEMLTSDSAASLGLLSQLLELWPVLPLALVALVIGWRRRRLVVLAPLALLTADCAYALWINPMGVIDRQVGHMAGACLALLGGLGAAVLCSLAAKARSKWPRWLALLATAALAVTLLGRLPRVALSAGYAESELLGSGGPLARVAPRTLLLCFTDDACAGALFALDVEAVRPDVDVAPAQHLWDATILRRLEGFARLSSLPGREIAPAQRRAAANFALRMLVTGAQPRPVLLEASAPLRLAGLSVSVAASENVPYLRALPAGARPTFPSDALTRLDRMRQGRLGSAQPGAERARSAWSAAYDTLGAQAVGSQIAVSALRTAVAIAPERAVAWTNLGVALEATGDSAGAIACAMRAIGLEPGRSTAWVNLLRLHLARRDPAAARHVLELANRAGVRDPRISEIARELDPRGQ
jgi:tetratricopeptide (TPR) repeat protein